MISRVAFTHFGCLRAVTVKPLTRLHALIGPNDSGKSTFLRGLHLACMLRRTDAGAPVPPTPELSEDAAFYASLTSPERPNVAIAERKNLGSAPENWGSVPQAMKLRLQPHALRESSGLIASGRPIGFATSQGRGLPAVYDAILSRAPRSFLEIEDEVKRLFPTVESLRLENATENTKALAITLRTKEIVAARDMSEGLLYFLAFAALPHLDGLGLLLLEEPENGLHPARVADVMNGLKALSAKVQVILTTHSPLVVNELKGDEVTLLTRTEEGTKATRLSETFNYAERSKVYSNGELWLSFADGNEEKDLLNAPEKVA